jgi:hypothetical protein
MIAMPITQRPLPGSRPVFRVLCAWCEQPIPQAHSTATLSGTSHGICQPCARRHFGLELESLVVSEVRAE